MLIAAREHEPETTIAPASAPAAPVAAAPAAPAPQAIDYQALWRRAIEREGAGVIAQRRALGLD